MRRDTSRRMLRLIDHDELFRRSTAVNPLILNKIPFTDKDYAAAVAKEVYSRAGDGDFVASCPCGATAGNYFYDPNHPITCRICHQPVTLDISADNALQHKLWLKFPDEIGGVLHPIAYLILAKWLDAKTKVRVGNVDVRVSYIDIIVNPTLDLPAELEGVVLGRGHRYFYDHFDQLMQHFAQEHPVTAKRANVSWVWMFIQANRQHLFRLYAPVLDSVLHPIITTDGTRTGRKQVDPASRFIQDATAALSFLEFNPKGRVDPNVFEDTVHGAFLNTIEYVKDAAKRRLSEKPSIPRKHLFGTRLHWTFRSVITPIVTEHDYDELHIPWSIAVVLLSVHLRSLLVRRFGYTMSEAKVLLMRNALRYHEHVHQALLTLIQECPFKGLPCLFGRNPSLKRGSLQQLFITQVKTDLTDKSISLSTLVLAD